MKCPGCGSDFDKVVETRSLREGSMIRRRRLCLKCGTRFTSYERIENKPILVIKRDKSKQPFDISKIERGIIRCTEKLEVSQSDIDSLLFEIEGNIYLLAGKKNTVTSKEVGDEVLKALHKLSPVAYIRFAAVYKQFRDIGEFVDEIEKFGK